MFIYNMFIYVYLYGDMFTWQPRWIDITDMFIDITSLPLPTTDVT